MVVGETQQARGITRLNNGQEAEALVHTHTHAWIILISSTDFHTSLCITSYFHQDFPQTKTEKFLQTEIQWPSVKYLKPMALMSQF